MKPRKLWMLLLLACLLLALAGCLPGDGEGWTVWGVIFVVFGGLLSMEVQAHVNAAGRAKMYGTSEEEELVGSLLPYSRTIKWVWKKLHGEEESRAIKRVPTSALSPIRLSPESISVIQERFPDDEELAALVAQLSDAASEEEYAEALSQVEEHIGARLEQDGPQEG